MEKMLQAGLALGILASCKPNTTPEQPVEIIELFEIPEDLRRRFLDCLIPNGGSGFENNAGDTVWIQGYVMTSDGDIRTGTLEDVNEAIMNCKKNEADRKSAQEELERCFLSLAKTQLCMSGQLAGGVTEECYSTQPPFEFKFGDLSGAGLGILKEKGAKDWLKRCQAEQEANKRTKSAETTI